MGLDDANDDGVGECPGHEFLPTDFVTVPGPWGLVGMGMWHECVTPGCDARWYEPSAFEREPLS